MGLFLIFPCVLCCFYCYYCCLYGTKVTKFLELTRARDILLDPKKKEAYDKKLSHELLAKKQQREREAALDGKRRQMRDGA